MPSSKPKKDELDRAAAQINAMKLPGVKAKVVTRRKQRFTKEERDRIRLAREQLKVLLEEGD